MTQIVLPSWAQTMKEIFRAGTVSQFVISGNIQDLVFFDNGSQCEFFPLKPFLSEVMFAPQEVVIFYNRGKGIQIAKGGEHFFRFLQIFDKFHGSRFSADLGAAGDSEKGLDSPGLLPRDPGRALELIDRFINTVATAAKDRKVPGPESIAVVLDYANFIIPRGESLYLSGESAANTIKILNWAQDPAIMGANVATVLLTDNLSDLSELVVESAFNSKIVIKLPDAGEIEQYVSFLTAGEKKFSELSQMTIPDLTAKLVGLSRVNIRNLIGQALKNDQPIDQRYLAKLRKETIEKEAGDRLEFIESKRTLDDVAGHDEVKKWLREDAQLLKKGTIQAIPMGYLIVGRIGTGKTFMVECFAGECGIPVVAMKNFREKWVGATEGNLEKIFSILHALGQVVVFVDEADQVTGRRDAGEGDSGLSGRVYAMLAREMANTENRGKILWIFATSRPDLLEVDLKRQGRLDVHIPLFPPDDEAGIRALFLAMAKKLRVELKVEDLPKLPFKQPISGNEIEGLLIRAVRTHELQAGAEKKKTFPEILREAVAEFRPSIHTEQLELMDLLAVKECTDERFLPHRFKRLSKEELSKRIDQLTLLI